MAFKYGIGKGLREPCSPYREAYFFGAELNEPSAAGWNCIPAIVGSTTSFDLSTISENHEVVVALLGVTSTREGTYTVTFRWYRQRDNKVLYSYSWSRFSRSGEGLFVYSYIGWTNNEISENGDYYVDIEVSGIESYTKTIQFSVIGIPEKPPEPEPVGAFMSNIVNAFNFAASLFYLLYVETFAWVWPFNLLATWFYNLNIAFNRLAWNFYDFSLWVYDVTDKVRDKLDFGDIWSYLDYWLNRAAWSWEWILGAWDNIGDIVDAWWTNTRLEVQAWIDDAKRYADALLANVNNLLTTLESAWDDFKGRIPTIDEVIAWWRNWPGYLLAIVNNWWTGALTEVQSLINSAFTEREPFWAGWQEWREKVTEFFTDPEDWLYKAMDRIIERFW